jgi:hypothetical protein
MLQLSVLIQPYSFCAATIRYAASVSFEGDD